MTKFKKFLKISTIITLSLASLTGLGFIGYDYVSNQTRIIYLDESNVIDLGEITSQSVDRAIEKLKKFNKSDKVVFYIYSPGGEVIAGQKLIKEMQQYNTVCVANVAASMAFSIFQQGCKVRLVTENSVLMQHRVRLGAGGPTWNDLQDMLDRNDPQIKGHEDEVKKIIEQMKKLEKDNNEPDSKRLGMSVEQFTEKIAHAWWLKGSKEILDAKAADDETIAIRKLTNPKELLIRLPNTGSERAISVPDRVVFYLKRLLK